jgi:hypothetical protein
VDVTFNTSSYGKIKYFNKGFRTTVRLSDKAKWCSANNNKKIEYAKNWLISWVSNPETKKKFMTNWGIGVDGMIRGMRVDDIFRKYVDIIKNVKPEYYSFSDNFTYTSNFEINTKSRKDTIAFVNPTEYGSDKVLVNCDLIGSKDSNNILVHEIQHLLNHYFPMNPSERVKKMYNVKNPTNGINVVNMRVNSKRYGIPENYIKQWYDNAVIEYQRGNRKYSCDDDEKMSNIMSLRRTLNITPEKSIQVNDMIPYIKQTKKDIDIDAYWLLVCWAISGYPDLQQWINGINSLAINGMKKDYNV